MSVSFGFQKELMASFEALPLATAAAAQRAQRASPACLQLIWIKCIASLESNSCRICVQSAQSLGRRGGCTAQWAGSFSVCVRLAHTDHCECSAGARIGQHRHRQNCVFASNEVGAEWGGKSCQSRFGFARKLWLDSHRSTVCFGNGEVVGATSDSNLCRSVRIWACQMVAVARFLAHNFGLVPVVVVVVVVVRLLLPALHFALPPPTMSGLAVLP